MKIGCENLSFQLTNRDGTPAELKWKHKNLTAEAEDDLLKVSLPVQDRRSGPPLNLRIEVYKNGSPQAAGRRIALFTRLMDEYSLTTLPKNKTNSTSVKEF